jgi:hypothetical protein
MRPPPARDIRCFAWSLRATAEALKSRDAFTSALEKTAHRPEDAAATSRAEQLKEDSETLQSPDYAMGRKSGGCASLGATGLHTHPLGMRRSVWMSRLVKIGEIENDAR